MQNQNMADQFAGWPPAALACGRRLTLAYLSVRTTVTMGGVAGGLSPVFLTSFSVVTVVVPPGVDIFVSVLVDCRVGTADDAQRNHAEANDRCQNAFHVQILRLRIDTAARRIQSETDSAPCSKIV